MDTTAAPEARGGPTLEAAARATARLSKLAEVSLDTAGLSLPQYRMMVLLADGSAAAASLADRLMVSRPSITALTDGLVQRGFVERVADPVDRRRMTHTLTPAGCAALARGTEAIESALARTVAHLPDHEADEAIRGLAGWLAALDAARTRRELDPT